jgi:hypothetical protein
VNENEVRDDGGIWVLELADEPEALEDEDRGALLDHITTRYQRTKLSAEQLRDNLGEFLDSLEKVVQRIPAAMGGFSVDTVTLSAEINAKGTVSLVGTGGEVGAKGGIAITLKRRT